MILLVIGLLMFLGMHSVRVYADEWRRKVIESRGRNAYRGLYSLVSLAGLVLIVLGYPQTRLDPVHIWSPPVFMVHVAALLNLLAFVLLAAAYVPGNHIRRAVGHPMLLAVKVWAFAHLLANGRLGDIILFGAFLAWAIIDYVVSRKRDRREGVVRIVETGIARDAIVVIIGVMAWWIFAMWIHVRLFGVSPLGA